jgi:hypothetical protein
LLSHISDTLSGGRDDFTSHPAEDTTMRLTRLATRNHLRRSNNEHLPDRSGRTIAGATMKLIGPLEILERGEHGISRGGALSGADQVVADSIGRPGQADRGIALSDGSRICFTSIADAGLLRYDDAPMAMGGQTPIQKQRKAEAPKHGKPRGMSDSKASAAGMHRAGELVSV